MVLDAAAAERWRRLREALEGLVELGPAEREAALAALDPALAAEARTLLAADSGEASAQLEAMVASRAAELLASEQADGSGDAETGGSLAGLTLGPWRLERLLGRGGMAQVWEARRADGQFEQTVAVKLLKRGLESEEIVRRFLQERQILARLDHPGIARLFDGGLTPDDRPYFVLERVEGEAITDWCAARGLDVAARLRLLVDCCEAVAAAHRQLVVHRDLKPSNILVTHDGQVKLLDFGIAKLLAEDDAAGDATRAEVRVLTPAYAAPEQILGEPVSTATDVYALGVLAYELLTGKLPHRRGGRAAELASAVRSESIARPSTAVAAADQVATARRPPEPRDLSRELRGDLDAILLTALRREPERRYPSVAALAQDIERYLEGRPVAARPDSFGYRARKLFGRHRVAVLAASLALLSLVGGLVAALWQAQRAREAAAAEARSAAAAREEVTKSQAITAFLTDVFTAADPEGHKAADSTASELVQRGVAQVDKQLAQQPSTRAAMLHVLGTVEYRLGLYEAAKPLLEQALAVRRKLSPVAPVDVANSAAALGVLYHRTGHEEDAAKLLEEALALHERAGPSTRVEVAKDLNNLANTYKAMQRVPAARAAFVRAIDILEHTPGVDPGQLPRVLNNYGLFLTRLGEHAAARDALERALALHERNAGPDSVLVAGTLGNLAELYVKLNDVPRALAAAQRDREVCRKVYGPLHYETGLSHNEVGWVLLVAHRPAEARPAFEQSIAVLRQAVGDDHQSIGYPYRNLGRALAETGHPAEGIAALRHAIAIWEAKLPPNDPELASAYTLLAPLLIQSGDTAGGERMLVRTIEVRQAAGNPALGEAWLDLARARLQRCALEEARAAAAKARAEAAAHADAEWVAQLAPLERELAAATCAGVRTARR